MNRTLHILRICGATLALGNSLMCSTDSTSRLINQADSIVVAVVQSGRQVGTSVAFRLSIVRTIKGALRSGTTADISWTSPLRANKDLTGDYGLWFLRQAGTRRWTLLPAAPKMPYDAAYFPMPQTSEPTSIRTSFPPATVEDEAAVEFAAGLRASQGRFQFQHLAEGLLGINNSTIAPALYREMRASSDPEQRFVGLTGLLGKSDLSALAEIADNANLVPHLASRGLVLSAISARRDNDPAAVKCLTRIATFGDDGLASSAASALQYIHTRETLPALAQLLDSRDPNTREAAMRGLSRFVDNLPIATPERVLNGNALISQGPTPYRTSDTDRYSLSRRLLDPMNEAEYLQFWKSWWATMQGKVMATTP